MLLQSFNNQFQWIRTFEFDMAARIQLHGSADKISLYRNFAFSTIDQDCEQDSFRPTIVKNFVHCGAHSSAGLQDIIDQDDSSIVNIGWQTRWFYRGMQTFAGKVIAIKGNVQSAQLSIRRNTLL
jgi:hypothetical protein